MPAYARAKHRVLLRRLLEVVERAAQARLAALLEEVAAAQVQIVRLEIGRAVVRCRRCGARRPPSAGVEAPPDVSSGEIAATIAVEISSCTLNTSFDSRSNMSDQTVNPSAVFTRRAVTRRRVLSRCTVPASTIVDVERFADVGRTRGLIALRALSVAVGDAQSGNPAQRVRQLGRHAGGEIRVARVAADVDERHHRDRLRGDDRRARRCYPSTRSARVSIR